MDRNQMGTHGDGAMHDHPMDGMDGMGVGGMVHAMSPFLFSRTQRFFVLFQEAFIESTGAFVAALFLSGLFALLATVFSQISRLHENRALRGSAAKKAVGSLMHAFRQALHYFAMLIVMTMNIWLIIAVVVGHGLGWLIFAFVFGKKVAAKQQATGNDVDPCDDC